MEHSGTPTDGDGSAAASAVAGTHQLPPHVPIRRSYRAKGGKALSEHASGNLCAGASGRKHRVSARVRRAAVAGQAASL